MKDIILFYRSSWKLVCTVRYLTICRKWSMRFFSTECFQYLSKRDTFENLFETKHFCEFV